MSLALVMVLSLCGKIQDRLDVQISVKETSYFVGQSIEVRIGVVATDTRPKILAPRLSGGLAFSVIREEFRQITSSGIGDQVAEQNLYVTRYRLVPKVPGPLTIPPFRASLGDRTGQSKPILLSIKPLPAGRPPGFLGGVGPITLRSEVVPPSVRVGQEFELQLKLTGPGARGSLEPPDTTRLNDLPINVRVTPLPSEEIEDPPSRTFRYRLRPERAGECRIPGFNLAWFDPTSERYFSLVSNSVGVRVTEVAPFNPNQIIVDSPLDETRSRAGWLVVWATVLIATGGLVWAVLRFRSRRIRLRSLEQVVHTVVDRIKVVEEAELGETVIQGLSAVVSNETALASPELTPLEFQTLYRLRFRSDVVGDQARNLAERCDRIRFSGLAILDWDLRAQAIDFLHSLSAPINSKVPL